MSVIFSHAYTVAFPKDSKITWSQAFEGLRYKAGVPMSFVPAIAAAEVLEQNSGYIKRHTTLKNGAQMLEDIHLYAPSLVTFKANTGQLVTNLISENAQGELLLTFTFYIPVPDVVSGSKVAEAKLQELEEAGKGAVLQSMKTILAMLEEGKLN
ncbi:unnamed protein product [Rhizoctonia solani]|uniref:Uncharacterized protein n=1 Tax=Rhizoctonia solani TaxID=456999 RepID=A0A8H3GBU8_9AGAM|nr:unnamed protein product [Rhizoctonia solani]